MTAPETPCIEWQGARTPAGYGQLSRGGKNVYAHRDAYEKARGPIPAGLELDHLCRNRACYRVDHLEAVTHAENMRRGYFGSKTHCPQGHPYEGDNLQINSSNGGRQCLTCVRARKHRYYRAANPEDRSQASRTHCPQGHPYSGDNLDQRPPTERYPNGRRFCRACRRKQSRESARRRSTAANPRGWYIKDEGVSA